MKRQGAKEVVAPFQAGRIKRARSLTLPRPAAPPRPSGEYLSGPASRAGPPQDSGGSRAGCPPHGPSPPGPSPSGLVPIFSFVAGDIGDFFAFPLRLSSASGAGRTFSGSPDRGVAWTGVCKLSLSVTRWRDVGLLRAHAALGFSGRRPFPSGPHITELTDRAVNRFHQADLLRPGEVPLRLLPVGLPLKQLPYVRHPGTSF